MENSDEVVEFFELLTSLYRIIVKIKGVSFLVSYIRGLAIPIVIDKQVEIIEAEKGLEALL